MTTSPRLLHQFASEARQLAGTEPDSSALRRQLLDRLQRMVAVDAYCFHTADPVSLELTTTVTQGVDPALGALVFANEYLEPDFLKHARLARGYDRVGVLTVVTGGDTHRSSRYRKVLHDQGVADELRAALTSDGACWGYLHLFRHDGRPSFSADDATLVQRAAPSLAEALRIHLLAQGDGRTVDHAAGVVLIDSDGVASSITPEADRWLNMISFDRRWAAHRQLPEGIIALAFATRARCSGRSPTGPTRSTLRARDGTWLSLHSSWLRAPDSPVQVGVESAGSTRDGQVSVVIQPAQPAELAQVLMRAHRLTPGERSVVELVLLGLSTRAIAAQLNLSPYTVQDRLKVVFDKTHVRSRSQLVADLVVR